mmetsp:Transcript_7335/g.22593  ORF Transcript_7335/g.22593 Transcript_7335/m.22593 type:complete len:324 (+) Transcript_7335:334-1305(+)
MSFFSSSEKPRTIKMARSMCSLGLASVVARYLAMRFFKYWTLAWASASPPFFERDAAWRPPSLSRARRSSVARALAFLSSCSWTRMALRALARYNLNSRWSVSWSLSNWAYSLPASASVKDRICEANLSLSLAEDSYRCRHLAAASSPVRREGASSGMRRLVSCDFKFSFSALNESQSSRSLSNVSSETSTTSFSSCTSSRLAAASLSSASRRFLSISALTRNLRNSSAIRATAASASSFTRAASVRVSVASGTSNGSVPGSRRTKSSSAAASANLSHFSSSSSSPPPPPAEEKRTHAPRLLASSWKLDSHTRHHAFRGWNFL